MPYRDYIAMGIMLTVEVILLILFIDKRDKRKLACTYLFTVTIATVFDTLSVALGLWSYPSNPLPGIGINLPADFLYYPSFAFFYIQYLPRRRWLPHTALFALLSLLAEGALLRFTTLIKYGPGMSPGLAYIQYFLAYLALRKYITWHFKDLSIPNYPRR